MKKQALLFAILLMVSVLLQAQNPERNAILHPDSLQVGSYFNPPQLGFKPERMVVPAKRCRTEGTGIDVSGMKPGVYFVRFSNVRMTRVLKFIKN